jgi:hypothetical protein
LKPLCREEEADQRAFQWKERPPNGPKMACKRLEAQGFAWPPAPAGLITPSHARAQRAGRRARPEAGSGGGGQGAGGRLNACGRMRTHRA